MARRLYGYKDSPCIFIVCVHCFFVHCTPTIYAKLLEIFYGFLSLNVRLYFRKRKFYSGLCKTVVLNRCCGFVIYIYFISKGLFDLMN